MKCTDCKHFNIGKCNNEKIVALVNENIPTLDEVLANIHKQGIAKQALSNMFANEDFVKGMTNYVNDNICSITHEDSLYQTQIDLAIEYIGEHIETRVVDVMISMSNAESIILDCVRIENAHEIGCNSYE